MRPHAKTKLGFYPLPVVEASRLREFLRFPLQFSALDACVGDGAAFTELLVTANPQRYGIEVDAYRAEQARARGINTLQADLMEVKCPADSLSLIYLNPPYDFEAGKTNNQPLEAVFLEHIYRWLKPSGVLIFVIPQRYLTACARLLAEHFSEIRVFKLADPECVKFEQIVVFALRRRRGEHLNHDEVVQLLRYLEGLGDDGELPVIPEKADAAYTVPSSEPVVLAQVGIPLDQLEDLLLSSSAYRQISRLLLREQGTVRGRPLTPLHGGHVGLLCTAGMLNGVFGEGSDRHIAHWRSLKFIDHWEEGDEDGAKILHDRERFSHELTLLFADGRTQILTHEKKNPS